jgi:hypothetical protein
MHWHIKDTEYVKFSLFRPSCYLLQMFLLVELPESSGKRAGSYPRRASSSPRLPRSHSPGEWMVGQWWLQFWAVSLTPHNQSINIRINLIFSVVCTCYKWNKANNFYSLFLVCVTECEYFFKAASKNHIYYENKKKMDSMLIINHFLN